MSCVSYVSRHWAISYTADRATSFSPQAVTLVTGQRPAAAAGGSADIGAASRDAGSVTPSSVVDSETR